jgi:predicted AlkP superfamily pyrophosphatase or phosphodiesterase
VVAITVDQLLPSYLERWRGQLTGGLARLMAEGAVFTHAFQDHALTETAPGHATVLSGRWPRHTGIFSNATGVGDSASPLVEVSGPGASPHRFRGTALFDWLQAAEPDARALSVSRKDRGAILPVGRAKQHVYWYQTGMFTTSRYYADSLPGWVRRFNAVRAPFKAADREWTLLLPDSAYPEPDAAPWENGGRSHTFPHRLPADSLRAAGEYTVTPWIDSLTLAFALTGLEQLRLGRRGTDLLAVGLSGTDAVGHRYGPDSREVHDQVLRLDRYLGWFLEQLERRVGGDRLLVVLTADHGVTPFPAASRARGLTAHDVRLDTLVAAVNRELDAAHRSADAPQRWLRLDDGVLFLEDNGRLAAAGIDLDSAWTALGARIHAVPGVARVDRVADLARADTAEDAVARRWIHQLPRGAPVPLVVSLAPGSAWAADYAMHGQPSDADAHVPLVLWGRGVTPGTYARRAATVDIAPTLARLLDLAPQSVLDGRVLVEALAPER